MGTTGLRRVATALAATVAVSAAAAAAPAAVAPSPPECAVADFSPAFAADRKGFCIAFDTSDGNLSNYRFFLTHDGGRSWERREGSGWTVTPDDLIGSVVVSPRYTEDGAVFVQTSAGLFVTTDDGGTFELLDGLSTPGPTGPNLSAYVETAPAVPPAQQDGERTVLALAAGGSSARIDPPFRTPVAGSPLDDRRFLFPAPAGEAWAAYAMALEVDNTQGTPRSRSVLFACDEAIVCAEALHAFPWGQQFEIRGGIWFAPDFAAHQGVYVTTNGVGPDGASTLRAWKSRDGGATFRRWRSVNRFLKPLEGIEGSEPRVGLALHESRPRTIYMRLSYSPGVADSDNRPGPPAERFFVSRNRGRTWTRLAYGLGLHQKGRPGTIPWDRDGGALVARNYVSLMADGTLFVMASELGGHSGLYCSTDGGRHWRPTCR